MNLRSSSIILGFLVLLSTVALAARGPCSVTVPPSSTSTIGCSLVTTWIYWPLPPYFTTSSDCLCTGSLVVSPQQKACANTDESGCTPMAIDLVVTYSSMNGAGVTGGNCGWVVQFCGGTCVQDVTTRIATPGGSNC